MGIVNFGIPEHETYWLKKNMKLSVVVEGGTFLGGTALRLSKDFEKVYTIEKSEVMFNKAKNNINNTQNIKQLLGDTREHLAGIISGNDDILFWLDAHWSGGDTYGEDDECPLIEELEIIFNSGIKNFAILIDDARLFLVSPPLPHQIKNWPTIKQIVNIIPQNFDLIVHEDVIFIVPLEIQIRKYFQDIVTISWLNNAKKNRNIFFNTIKYIVKRIKL